MNTFYSDDTRMSFTNATTSTIASGSLVIIRSGAAGMCGVAVADIAAAATGAVETRNVHKLTAATGAWSYGAVLYRDASTGALTTVSTLNTRAGTAAAAKTTAATVGYCALNR